MRQVSDSGLIARDRRWRRSAVALMVALAVSSSAALAQEGRRAAFDELMVPYPVYAAIAAAYEAAFAGGPQGDRDAAARAARAFSALIEYLQSVTGDSAVGSVDNVCAALLGSGGVPRVDGGGGNPHVDGGGATRLVRTQGPSIDPTSLDVWPSNHLVIVDSFDLDALAMDFGAVASGAVAPHALAGDWALASRQPAADAPHEAVVEHGHVVLAHVLSLIQRLVVAAVAFDVTTTPADGGVVQHALLHLVIADGVDLEIHLVHIEFDQVDTIARAMAFAAALQTGGLGSAAGNLPRRDGDAVESVVVTSWGLTDCTLAERYADTDVHDPDTAFESFVAYVIDLALSNPDGYVLLDELCLAFEPYLPSGVVVPCTPSVLAAALFMVLDDRAASAVGWPRWPAQEHLIGRVPYGRVYAAAGNQSLPFPMPPAAWPGVYGVSACDAVEPTPSARSWYANLGDYIVHEHMVAPGGAFAAPIVGARLGYYGTSYAAPHAALAIGTATQWRTWPLQVGSCWTPAAVR